MTWIKFKAAKTILRCAAVFVAHFVCAVGLAVQDVVFQGADDRVAATGRFVAFLW
jgi:hypothetical protein